MKVSLIMGSFMRPKLLNLSLWSLSQQKVQYDFEVIILNDGIKDGTEEICNQYKNKLNIKYFFTGQRNTKDNLKVRNSGFALNIGIKQSKGKIIILSNSGIYHLKNTVNLIVKPLITDKKILTTPTMIYMDDIGIVTNYLLKTPTIRIPDYLIKEIQQNPECERSPLMPFFMGLYKNELMEISGYDEDFIGYAGDDNDLVHRLLLKGLTYFRTKCKTIHLYHGKRCDSRHHWANPEWVYNYNLFIARKDIIIRNVGKEWGKICGI